MKTEEGIKFTDSNYATKEEISRFYNKTNVDDIIRRVKDYRSYFDYKTMGFGEVIKKEDDLIKLIKGYLDNDCKMKEVYKKRVDEFYKYNDQNKSKRVYNWIYEN